MTALYKQVVSGQSAPATKQKVKTPVFLIADEKACLYWDRVGDKKNDILTTYTNIPKPSCPSSPNLNTLFPFGMPLQP
jgi:hypothetical protein